MAVSIDAATSRQATGASPVWRWAPYYARYRRVFLAGTLTLLCARGLEALIPLLLRHSVDAIDAALPAIGARGLDPLDAQALLVMPVLGIVLCVLIRLVTMAQGRRVIRRVGIHVAYDLRKRVYAHLQRQGPTFFARHPTGDLMARAINDIGLVRELVAVGFRTIAVNVFMAVIGLLAMLWLAPALTLLLLLPMVPIGLVGWFAARGVYRRSLAVQEGFATLSERVEANLQGIRTVQALVQEDAEIKRFDVISDAYVARYESLVRFNSFISAVMPWLAAFATAIIIGVGGGMVRDGAMSLGTFAAFFAYVLMVLGPVRELGQMVTLWQRGASGIQRLVDILDQAPEVQDAPSGRAPAEVRGAIALVGLDYRYPDAPRDALQGVDLRIEPGEIVALMGRVGAGKSTLLSCLVRLLEPPPGRVLLDGIDVREYPLDQLRRQVVLVPQDPFLFAELLKHNLSYDDPERDADVVWAAVEDVDLAGTVRGLDAQLETLVGERGVTLSGGQKQRTALARGMIRDARVLVLDDCLSAVDTRTEEHILERLLVTRAGRTTLLVTNRVSTARHAGRIVILAEGRIAESGRHAELLAANGWYAHLARTQRLAAAHDGATAAPSEAGGGEPSPVRQP